MEMDDTFLDLTFRNALSVPEVITFLSISHRHLATLRSQKRLNPIGRFNKSLVYRKADVEAYKAARDLLKGTA